MARVINRLGQKTNRQSTTGADEREYEFLVSGIDPAADPFSATDQFTGLSVPLKGTIFPPLTGFVVQERTATEQAIGVWTVRVAVKGFEATTRDTANDPPIKWRWEPGVVGEQIDADFDKYPIVNSAGCPFQNTFPRNVRSLFLRVWTTETYFDVPTAYQYLDCVNESSMLLFGAWTIDPGQMYFNDITPNGDQTFTNSKFQLEHLFEFRNGYRPFQIKAIDQGFQGWCNDGGNKLGEFCYQNGDKVNDPVLLDGTGKPINTTIKVKGPVSATALAPVANPSIGSARFEVDPSSPATGKILIYPNYDGADFRGIIPGVM